MKSSTDSVEKSKTAIEDWLSRRANSSVKKKPIFPRLYGVVAPLNLNEIKKEVIEANNDENKNLPDIVEDPSSSNENFKLSECSDTQSKSKGEKTEKCILKETTDAVFHKKKETGLSIVDYVKYRNNVDTNLENKMLESRKHDSFDLDFSQLTIDSPCGPKHVNSASVLREEASLKDKTIIKQNVPSKIHSNVSENTSVLHSPPKMTEALGSITRTRVDNLFTIIKVNGLNYLVLSLLGRGGSSKVYQCFNMEHKRLVAIKCVLLNNSASCEGYINEVNLLKRLQNCDRIIKLYDSQILHNENKLLMVLERGGEDFTTVLKKLANQEGNIPLYMLIFYWMEMLQAVKQIHSHGIIHSDLKPSNFLIADKGLKLIDFGIASTVQTDMTSVIKPCAEGSCDYMSPEALNSEASNQGHSRYKLHYKSDVWSLGCILYQLVYRQPPFHHIKHLWQKLAFIMNPEHIIEYPTANWLPPKILETIKKCLQFSVKSRPSIDELICEYI